MSMDLAKQTFTSTPEYLIASTNIRIATAIKEAAAALKKGAPVKIDGNGKAAKVTANSDTGIYGIVADDVASGDDAVIYLTGEFFADALVLETGVTAAGLEIKLRDIGIFLKDGGSSF
jgi:hypothetical protein